MLPHHTDFKDIPSYHDSNVRDGNKVHSRWHNFKDKGHIRKTSKNVLMC